MAPAQAAASPRRRLGERVVTAAVLAPLALVAAVHLSTPWVGLVAAAIVLAAAWEWASLCALRGAVARLGYVALVAAAVAFGARAPGLVVVIAAAGWLAAVPWLVWLERADPPPPWPSPALRLAIGVPTLAGGWAGLVVVHAAPPAGAWLLLLLVAVWTADSAAYFAGRRWGRRRLAPRLSPGKTVTGAAAGVAAGAAVAVPWALALQAGPRRVMLIALATLLAVAFSVVGDLTESVLKRAGGAKDSGHLLPGHGGVLDRIDSLLAAAPLLAAAVRAGGLAE